MRPAVTRALATVAAALSLGASACVDADATTTHRFDTLRVDFELVSETLGARCGSLDCHGDGARPLRLYHHDGLRLADADSPDGSVTRQREHDANFLSVTGLEPELLDDVVSGLRAPDDITLVRKALGREHHDGGAVLDERGAAARCIVGWLEGELDPELCAAGSEHTRPE